MKATETNVINFVSGYDKVFLIPPFQRNYDWSNVQCEELFNDIVNAYRENSTHYIGNIIYYMSENSGASYHEFVLIDGQQRVTTILLLLCALRDLSDDQSFIDAINHRYLINHTSDLRFRVRLKQTAYDTDSFTAIIDKQPLIAKDNNVVRNYNLFKNLIQASGIACKDIYETLSRLEMVDINLQINNDLNKIQTVFEKINSTGKRLTPADLIRNYLLLSNSFAEQESLYNNYWVKIEREVGNDNISKFARDYLIMQIYEDFAEENTYKRFKDHFNETNISHIDILKEMYVYSEYYSWLIFQNCPNSKINKSIKFLKLLKTDDARPLYVYIMSKLYGKDDVPLCKIMDLLVDFFLRYRMVAPSGGGGSLRSVIYQLLEKLNAEEIKLDYDSILFELSNSVTPSGRFPEDDEFKAALMEDVNINYARVALVKLEEFERSNISVDINEITVEHLMPQTRTAWWISALGGEEEADRIYDKYLNCIGNLGPISPSYNSKNSNKPWSEKVKNLRDVQFVVTSEVACLTKWDETEIEKRNDALSDRICTAITSPLTRTRKFSAKGVNNGQSGIYPISDLSNSLAGSDVCSLIYKGDILELDTWRSVLVEMSKILIKNDSSKFNKLVEENAIHKSTSTRNHPYKDPIFTTIKEKLVAPQLIENTQYYVEGCLSSHRVRVYAKQLAEYFNDLEAFNIEITFNK